MVGFPRQCVDDGKLNDLFDEYGNVDTSKKYGEFCKNWFRDRHWGTGEDYTFGAALSNTCFSSEQAALEPRCTGMENNGQTSALAKLPDAVKENNCKGLLTKAKASGGFGTQESQLYEERCVKPLKTLCSKMNRPYDAFDAHFSNSYQEVPPELDICGCHVDVMQPTQTSPASWYKTGFLDEIFHMNDQDYEFEGKDGKKYHLKATSGINDNNACGAQAYYNPCADTVGRRGYGDSKSMNKCDMKNIVNCISTQVVDISKTQARDVQINAEQDCGQYFAEDKGGDEPSPHDDDDNPPLDLKWIIVSMVVMGVVGAVGITILLIQQRQLRKRLV